jgi:hypothetical protein
LLDNVSVKTSTLATDIHTQQDKNSWKWYFLWSPPRRCVPGNEVKLWVFEKMMKYLEPWEMWEIRQPESTETVEPIRWEDYGNGSRYQETTWEDLVRSLVTCNFIKIMPNYTKYTRTLPNI